MAISMTRSRWTIQLAALALGMFCAGAAGAESAPGDRVTNYRDGETIRYPVALLRGTCRDEGATSVTLINASSSRPTRQMTGLAHRGRFKVLAELVEGENKLSLRAGTSEISLKLTYRPQTNPYVVRVIYWTDRTGDVNFQSPRDDQPRDFRGRLDTAAKLMQTFTAEQLNEQGYGRATFNLELDSAGKVKVRVMRGELSMAQYHAMDGNAWYGQAAREMHRAFPGGHAHNLVIPAFTRFDANTKKVYSHTALGGGDLALFGGGDLFAWPASLDQVQAAFLDANRVDPNKIFSDSVGRHTYWALASTTIGAALHELGHTFGLPHSLDGEDIMTRGIDRFNRVFTFYDPPHAGRLDRYEFKDAEVARWAPVSAAVLAADRFLALDDRPWSDARKTRVTLDESGKAVKIESAYGIRAVCVNRYGPGGTEGAFVWPIDVNSSPRELAVPLGEIGRKLANPKASLHVVDGQGLHTWARIADLAAGTFVQAWRFAKITKPWTDFGKFAEVGAADVTAIETSAASAALTVSPDAFVDFLSLHPGGKKEMLAGYAFRTIRSEKSQTIKLFTGSDDALRVWVNGKLVASAMAQRAAKPDSECNAADLVAGENRLLVEVSQARGGWGMYLRIEDAGGVPLLLADDGTLSPAKGRSLAEIEALLRGKPGTH